MATVGIHPTSIEVLNSHPTKIPPDKTLGGVVQNCLIPFISVTRRSRSDSCYSLTHSVIVSTDLTDVTLVSDEEDEEDGEDEEYEEDEKSYQVMKIIK